MCQHGTERNVKLNHPRESGRRIVPVDACIADEVQMLNDMGVITVGSCCGHGKGQPHVLINEYSATLVQKLGYMSIPYFHGPNDYRGIHEVILKQGERGYAPLPSNLIVGISDAMGAVVEF